MERWVGKVAFVTGASSGIGEAIVEKLVEEGLTVVGFARRKERLEEAAKKLSSKKGKFYSYKGDVSKEEDILNAFKWTKENVGPVSILVNNAGVGRRSLLSSSSTEDLKTILDTNVLGLCICTREAIKQMKENNIDGHIININSVTGHKIGTGTLSIYPASKFAVTALTETLRLELANMKSKIKITSLSPGLVKTEILDVSQMPQEIREKFSQMPILAASDIADAVAYALSTPPHVQISELTISPVGEVY